jgi:hypothetical protein
MDFFSRTKQDLGMAVGGGGKPDICPLPWFLGKELEFEKRRIYAEY